MAEARSKRVDVGVKEVALEDGQSAELLRVQLRRQIPVQFNRDDPAGAGGQRTGERAAARPEAPATAIFMRGSFAKLVTYSY